MDELSRYLDEIVAPTFTDLGRNPSSAHQACLACVSVYHAVDRAAYPGRPGNLRRQWCKQSLEFSIVDAVAHRYKHICSFSERHALAARAIPLANVVFKTSVPDAWIGNPGDVDTHNLYFAIRDAIKFLRTQEVSLRGQQMIHRRSSTQIRSI